MFLFNTRRCKQDKLIHPWDGVQLFRKSNSVRHKLTGHLQKKLLCFLYFSTFDDIIFMRSVYVLWMLCRAFYDFHSGNSKQPASNNGLECCKCVCKTLINFFARAIFLCSGWKWDFSVCKQLHLMYCYSPGWMLMPQIGLILVKTWVSFTILHGLIKPHVSN